jgi:hypothetical protein
MLERLINWFISKDDDEPAPRASALGRSGAFKAAQVVRKAAPVPRPAPVAKPVAGNAAGPAPEIASGVDGEIAELGPGKNVLVRNKHHREESGSHETLSIVDDSIVQTGEEAGIDPYNTGKFDRSRHWDKRFR